MSTAQHPPQDTPPPAGAPWVGPPPVGHPGGPPPQPQPSAQPAPAYHRRHRPLRLGGAALVGLLVAGGAASNVPEMVRDAEVERLALPAGTQVLDLRAAAGEVVVRAAAEGEEPAVVADKHWSLGEPTTSVTTAGGVTSVALDCPPTGFVGRCYADWDVTVPADLSVVLRTEVGDVDVAGLTGDLEVHGSVGDVTVAGAPTTLDVTTSVGRVSATLEEPPDSVRLRTSVGDVDLRLPAGVAYDLVDASALERASVDVETSGTSPHRVEVGSSLGTVRVGDG